jgi:hypothetical protein
LPENTPSTPKGESVVAQRVLREHEGAYEEQAVERGRGARRDHEIERERLAATRWVVAGAVANA